MDQNKNSELREPVLNLPPVMTASLLVLVAIHAVRIYLLTPEQNGLVIAALAFIPVRLTAPDTFAFDWPGGVAGDVWTFVTYALLHGDWTHLVNNGFWMAAFGSPLARRFGAVRFLGLSALGAAAGAAAHLALSPYGTSPLVGASAAISAQMAAVARFAFAPGGRLSGRWITPDADHRPALSIVQMFASPRVLAFLGVWMLVNLLFGLAFTPPGIQNSQIAWESHIGGFLVGLLCFSLFDPVRRAA